MTLSKQEIISLLVGKTHTLELAPDKLAHIFYQTESATFMQLPDTQTPMRGTWTPTEGGYHCDWENGPSINWTLKMMDGKLTYIKSDGDIGGTVIASTPGDTAGLKLHFE